MTEEQERYAGVFDGVADAYARERPTYPDALVDQACAGVHTVLEIGCGTGQLTRALVARGLDVDALDPAPNMVAEARRHADATYHVGRFEDFEPPRRYDALFSASAFHWVDPRVSWDRAGAALKPGGRLALMQNIGLRTPETEESDEAFEAALEDIAPELAPPKARDLETIRRGVPGNVSELWAWLGGKPVAVPEVPFGPPTLTVVPVLREKTEEEFNALFKTTAFRFQLGEERAQALEAANSRLFASMGGVARWAEAMVLVTACQISPPARDPHV
jgi:SAM-dependent methyltransferase